MLKLHPTFLRKNGRKVFAILPYKEFIALLELLQDADDLAVLQKAREKNAGKPGYSLEEAKLRLGL